MGYRIRSLLGVLVVVVWSLGVPAYAQTWMESVVGEYVRKNTVISTVTTNTTSAVFVIHRGEKTFNGNITGTGAITQTMAIYGTFAETAIQGILLCTITLSGTTDTGDACPVITANFPNGYVVTTNTTGTGTSGTLKVGY